MKITTLLLFLSLFSCIYGLSIYQFVQDYMDEDDMYYDDYDWLANSDVVVSDNVVRPEWATPNYFDILVEGKYNSITNFIVEVDLESGEQFGPPECSIVESSSTDSNGDVKKVQSDDVLSILPTGDAIYGNFDEEDLVFFLKMNYLCKSEGTRTIRVDYTVINQLADPVRNITFYWKKQCGSGIREGFEVVVLEMPDWDEDSRSNVVQNGRTLQHWDYHNPEHTLAISRWETQFLISIHEGFGSQTFYAPVVECSDPSVLKVRALGEASEAGIVSEYDPYLNLKVLHTCGSTSGKATVTVTIDLGSFAPIKFAWIKSCEGSLQSGFEISSEPNGHGDVVKNSETREPWQVENPSIVIPATDDATTFYLRSTGAVLSISHPEITAKPSHIVKAKLTGDYAFGGMLNSETALGVEYTCLQKGKAVIKMTIPFSEHIHPIEFSWTKECPKFKRTIRQSQPGYLTANKAMVLFCFVVGVVGVLGYYTFNTWRRKRAAARRARLMAQQQQYDD